MSKIIKAIRGMNDISPEDTPYWRSFEDIARNLMDAFGYREIRFPIVEKTELFARSIGEVTDIVEKEMYTFQDRNGDQLSLRPEGTASCVRAALEGGHLYNQTQRVWYMGPMFRHERPQKGRYRQFHQIGVEAYGFDGPDIDAELIMMTARLWQALNLERLELQLNSLGSSACRLAYREHLVAYFSQYSADLDEDSQRRLHSNPLRILDSKNPAMQNLIAGAPKLIEQLDEESQRHFDRLRNILHKLGIQYTLNPRLVRGLDYYNKTVFEWVSDQLGAQGTVCAGGRYDGLVAQLGGKPSPAVGFAMGLERLIELTRDQLQPQFSPHVYLINALQDDGAEALSLANRLREALPGLRLICHCGGGSMKSQFKRADKSGARIALILGEQEQAEGMVSVKYLRVEEGQQAAHVKADEGAASSQRAEAQQAMVAQADLAALIKTQIH